MWKMVNYKPTDKMKDYKQLGKMVNNKLSNKMKDHKSRGRR